MREFQFHPKRKDWILASSWSKCQMKQKDCFVTKDLMISIDMGLNWEVTVKMKLIKNLLIWNEILKQIDKRNEGILVVLQNMQINIHGDSKIQTIK